jgi:hypothetical protein
VALPSTAPIGILYAIPIALTNSQTSPFLANAQIMVPISSTSYTSYEAGNLDNAEFFYPNGTVIPSWLEGSSSNMLLNTAANALNLYTSTNTLYWLRIYPSGNFLCASCSNTIYLGWASTSTNLMSVAGATGEAPQLTSTYGQYDNGASVFSYYSNMIANPATSPPGSFGSMGGTLPSSSSLSMGSGSGPFGTQNLGTMSAGSTGTDYYFFIQTSSTFPSNFVVETLTYSTASVCDHIIGAMLFSTTLGYLSMPGDVCNNDINIYKVNSRSGIGGSSYTFPLTAWENDLLTYSSGQLAAEVTSNLLVLPSGALPSGGVIQTASDSTYTSFDTVIFAPYFQAGASESWSRFIVRAYPPGGVMPSTSVGVQS